MSTKAFLVLSMFFISLLPIPSKIAARETFQNSQTLEDTRINRSFLKPDQHIYGSPGRSFLEPDLPIYGGPGRSCPYRCGRPYLRPGCRTYPCRQVVSAPPPEQTGTPPPV